MDPDGLKAGRVAGGLFMSIPFEGMGGLGWPAALGGGLAAGGFGVPAVLPLLLPPPPPVRSARRPAGLTRFWLSALPVGW